MSNKKEGKVFFAFAAGSESVESSGAKRYVGVAAVNVLAVNPTKEELEKIYNTPVNKEPVYISETNGREGTVKQIRVDFIVKADPKVNNGLSPVSKVSIFLNNEPKFTLNGEKMQIVNKYGDFTYITEEELKAGKNPNGWFEMDDIRPALVGEEEITGFLKALLNVPASHFRMPDGTYKKIENISDAEARLDTISKFFDGDISELKNIISMVPSYKVKVVFGVKNGSDGKLYQDIYTRKFLKNGITDYSRIDADIKNRQDNGAYPNTTFSVEPLKEFVVESTDFVGTETVDSSKVDVSSWFKN